MGMKFGFLAGILFTASIQASPITYIYTGSGSGSIGAISFVNDSFTITALTDTDNLTQSFGTPWMPHNSTSIDIAGVGTFSIDTPLGTFLAPDAGIVGLTRDVNGDVGGDLYDSGWEDVFKSWNMTTPIGPVATDDWQLMQWTLNGSDPISTSGGILNFYDGYPVNGSFQAVSAVPEPTSIGMISAIAASGLLKRRRK